MITTAGWSRLSWLLLLVFDFRLALGLSSQDPRRTSSASRRSVVAGIISAPWIVLNHPGSSQAEDRPGILYPNGGSNSLVRPFYEEGSWKPSNPLTTKLGKERILATQISPLGQIALPFSEQELYFPGFLFGSWTVKATLKSKKYPFGTAVVPSTSLLEGSPRNRDEQVGDTTSYEMHYFSTLADTISNQMTVNLGLGVPKPKIIGDRAFNAISLSKAYRQLAPVQEVDWDYRKDPTKLTLRYGAGALSDDMRPLGQRRGEVFFTARASEDGFDDSSGSNTYCTAERCRAVTLAPGNVIVSDSETITEFRQVDDEHVTAVSRIAVYLTPNPNSREGILWQQVGGKAVAFFDYELDMTRIKESFTMKDGSTMERACVKTPKDVVQCS